MIVGLESWVKRTRPDRREMERRALPRTEDDLRVVLRAAWHGASLMNDDEQRDVVLRAIERLEKFA